MLVPTPTDALTDDSGRPYFLWDVQLTLDDWFALARSTDVEERAYWLARALRDAKPDDVLTWFSTSEIAQAWPDAKRFVGRKRDFWVWYLRRRGHEVEP